jgi:hypothetical protein
LLRLIAEAVLEMFQDFDLRGFQRFLESIGKADEKMFPGDRGRAGHDAYRAARMHQRVVRPPHFHERNDLRSGEDVVRLVGHQ